MASRQPTTASFADLGVPARLVTMLTQAGRTHPFPIQAASLPDSLAGHDVLGRGQTGSGKTLAFAIPVVARLSSTKVARRTLRPRALILAPTRELAAQILATVEPLATSAGLRSVCIFGGVGEHPQIAAARQGVDIVVACPGRLDDLVKRGHVLLDAVEITVLDEADHMADLGFLPVVRRLMDATPRDGQRMLFSATLDGGVEVLVDRFMHTPVTHSVDPAQAAVSTMAHQVLQVDDTDRLRVLTELTRSSARTVVFTRTKHGAKKLAKQLRERGVSAVELHGNLAQNARTRNMAEFGDGSASTLVATDIAARGIHVDDVALVIHADPPVEHKAYLHRSGRTGRAGASGTVITLMSAEQHAEVDDLARKAGITPAFLRVTVGQQVPGLDDLPDAASAPMPRLAPGTPITTRPQNRSGGGSRQGGGSGRAKPAGAPRRSAAPAPVPAGVSASPGTPRRHRPRPAGPLTAGAWISPSAR